MIKDFLSTDDDIGGLLARLVLGAVILPHGLQQIFGLFGGAGFAGTMDYFTRSGLPEALAFLVIIGESLGAVGLIIGFLSRLCALGILIIMVGAIFMVHVKYGFFMNWYGNLQGEGFEYHILAIGLGLITLVKGGGKLSIDGFIHRSM